jgi:hypothetical protein
LQAEIKRLQTLIARANRAFQLTFTWAEFTRGHWDDDRDAKVGKCLSALSGVLKGYAPDTDAIHSIAKEVKAEAGRKQA